VSDGPVSLLEDARQAPLAAAGSSGFDYDTAFSRTLGWVTATEQRILRHSRVAIAGLGGVGGQHALTLARLGVGGLAIADFDSFDLPNMNRQAGAFMETLGRPKTAVMAEMLRGINPELSLRCLEAGVRNDDDAEALLEGCDLFVDGLDFFVMEARRRLFALARARGIPAITMAPLGMGCAWLVFTPDGMSFEDYFRLEDAPLERQYVKFMVGLAPQGLHRGGLIAPEAVNFADKAGPSTPMGCQMASAVMGTEALRLLLGRPGVRPAPVFHQFDPYSGRKISGRHRGGNAHPIRRLRIALAARWVRRIAPRGRDPLADSVAPDAPVIEKILDLARWAPSGDNEQPWRFEITGPDTLRVHLQYTPDANIYEYAEGRPVWLAAGALMETLALAASRYGRHCHWTMPQAEGQIIDVSLLPAPGLAPHRLSDFIKLRSVDRRPYRPARLDARRKAALEAAVGDAFVIEWLESPRARWAATRLNMRATHIRLRIPECFRVHNDVIRFDRTRAEEGLPAASVGLDPLTVRLMRWANARWWRSRLLNRWLGGARMASLQLDVLPGLLCGAHFTIRWRDGGAGKTREDWVVAGQAMQRFWLEATAQNLVLQPSFAPVIFAHHAASGKTDWEIPATGREASRLAQAWPTVWASTLEDVVFTGRIGHPKAPAAARSLRRPLDASLRDD